jgi:hypothetical protein
MRALGLSGPRLLLWALRARVRRMGDGDIESLSPQRPKRVCFGRQGGPGLERFAGLAQARAGDGFKVRRGGPHLRHDASHGRPNPGLCRERFSVERMGFWLSWKKRKFQTRNPASSPQAFISNNPRGKALFFKRSKRSSRNESVHPSYKPYFSSYEAHG